MPKLSSSQEHGFTASSRYGVRRRASLPAVAAAGGAALPLGFAVLGFERRLGGR